jgi:hypothetical protein
MKRKTGLVTPLVTIFAVFLAVPAFAGGKKHGNRAMIEKMEAIPCGARERGLTGLGTMWGSIGATNINSDEKLCPQYLLRTDDMEYHIRPLDHKHPVILPIGKEGEFKLSKDVMEMRVPDGDHKTRRYQVVSIKPLDHSETLEGASATSKYQPHNRYGDKPLAEKKGVKTSVDPDSPPQ